MVAVDDNNNFYMNLALEQAWKYQGLTYPNPAVGSLLLDKNSKIVAIQAHKKAGKPHAEVETLKSAFLYLSCNNSLKNKLKKLQSSSDINNFLIKNHNKIFQECTMYVTLEPCSHYGKTPPCASLIGALKLKKIFIGSLDLSGDVGGGIDILKSSNIEVKFGILKEKCDSLIEPFKLWSRKNFIFFKHAQSMNGTIDGGYISSKQTLGFVHSLRDKIDLIVVGGNTVRTDRPTLDSRRVNGKSPDVFIYSKQQDFDKTIPLFNIKDRTVNIGDNLKILKKYKFIMIEGGSNMFNAIRSKIDWHLTLVSNNFKQGINFNIKSKEKILHIDDTGFDIFIYSKII